MGRRCALSWALLSAGCVGTNPRWDGPDDGQDEVAVGSSDDSVGTTSDDDDASEASSSGIAESSWTGTDDSSSGSMPNADDDGGGPMCKDNESVCDGECKNTMKDRKACGPSCVDCTQMFDDDASCEAGECRPDNSGPGGGEDD